MTLQSPPQTIWQNFPTIINMILNIVLLATILATCLFMCFFTKLKRDEKQECFVLYKMLKQDCPYLWQDQGHVCICNIIEIFIQIVSGDCA